MVTIPAGAFRMGCLSNDDDCRDHEQPVHEVTIGRPFALSVYEVTFAEWDACVAAGGCGGHEPEDWGWGRGSRPVMNVSWDDARAYAEWLSAQTGAAYRLPSESEWEYAARAGTTRAGTTTKYSWGNGIGVNRANCDGCGSEWDDARTAPVGSFQSNAFGLYDLRGNVCEWVADCWNASYAGASSEGSRAWFRGDCTEPRFARQLLELRTEVPPLRAPQQVLRDHPGQQRRVPCDPDAHPMSRYVLTSCGGIQGGLTPLGRFRNRSAVARV